MSTTFTNARLAALRAAAGSASGTTFHYSDRLGTSDVWHFATAGHGYYAAHIPGLHRSVANVLSSNEWLIVDLDTETVAGEEDCASAVVLWTAMLYDVPLPDYIKVSALAESCERWFPGLIDRIGAARAKE